MSETRAPIALFYGSSTCYTEMAGEKISRTFGDHLIDSFNIRDEGIAQASLYSYIIFGIPTWDYGELQEDWEEIWDEIDDIDFSGKKVALYGLGDQIGYPEWFLDAMGYLHDKVKKLDAEIVGYWPNTGYEYEASTALTEDKAFFVGLALDEENEFSKTQDRIDAWCEQLRREFNING